MDKRRHESEVKGISDGINLYIKKVLEVKEGCEEKEEGKGGRAKE